jgi:hypothetical protein
LLKDFFKIFQMNDIILTLMAALLVFCMILLCTTMKKKQSFEAGPTGVQYLCDDYGLCNQYDPVMTADNKGTPLYRGRMGLGRYPDDEWPETGCDLAHLHTGRPDGAMGSPLDPTTITYPELIGYFGTGLATAYTPAEMAAMRSRDGLVHAGWVNHQQPGYLLTNSDRWPTGYKYQVGSSIQVVT